MMSSVDLTSVYGNEPATADELASLLTQRCLPVLLLLLGYDRHDFRTELCDPDNMSRVRATRPITIALVIEEHAKHLPT